MYIPSHYKNENLSEVRAFITSHPFAILVNHLDGNPWATHTPLELTTDNEGRDVLIGHIARANPQWHAFEKNPRVLCIFQGPHTYVSSSWYREEEVPTWNYIAVHVYGTLQTMGEAEVLAWLRTLIDHFEESEEHPVSLDRMSDATLRQVRGVVGFRIYIEEIKAAYKLSQGREEDHPRIISELSSKEDHGSREISGMMKKRASDKKG